MDKSEHLDRIRAFWARAWPVDILREPHYLIGHVALTDHLRRWARTAPDKPAIHFYGHDMTFARLDNFSDRVVALFARHGIGAGDRVAVLLSNYPQFNVVFFGILKLGAVYVPISPLSQRTELMHALGDATSRVIVMLGHFMLLARDVRVETSVEHAFITCYADVLPTEPALSLPAILTEPPLACGDAIDLLSTLAQTTPIPLPVGSFDTVAALNYTGGTTGLPKSCIHIQGDTVDMAATFLTVSLRTDVNTVMLSSYPQFRIAGENIGLTFPAFLGVLLVLLARWGTEASMVGMQRYRVTNGSMLVDSAVEVMAHPCAHAYDLRLLRHTGVSSFVKKLNPEYRHAWRELTGLTVAESAWGMMETQTCNSFTVGMQDDDFDLRSQPIFVDPPVPGTDFKICNSDTHDLVPIGVEGELCVRTPTLLKGYWNKSEATAQTLCDGWFHTGDIDCTDERGYVHYLGRRKEMLKVNGMSVFPAEVKATLGKHPAILGSAVVGRADERRGQLPVTFMMLHPGAVGMLDSATLTGWCRENMAGYKVPTVRIVDAPPLTVTGRVCRQDSAPLAEQL